MRVATRRGVLRNAVWTVAAVALVLATAEAVLRVVPAKGLATVPRAEASRDVFILDLLWIPEPFTSSTIGRSLAENPFNDVRNVPRKPAPNVLRVICLGGSVTQGWGAPPGADYPRQLESVLNERLPPPWKAEVLNAGALGLNAYSGLFFFDRLLRAYAPDLVTVHYTVNDSQTSATIGLPMSDRAYVEAHRRAQASPPVRAVRAVLERSRIALLAHRAVRAVSVRVARTLGDSPRATGYGPRRNPLGGFEDDLNGFVDLGEKDGFAVALMYEGMNFTDYARPIPDQTGPYRDAIERVARSRGVPMFIPDRVLSSQPKPRASYFVDGCHMNAEGLRLFAEDLATELLSTGTVDRAIAFRNARDARVEAR